MNYLKFIEWVDRKHEATKDSALTRKKGLASEDVSGFCTSHLIMNEIYNPQRFVSSTRNIEVLLSHTHSIVCDNDIGGLFLGCSKFCKMAAHNLKIHFNSLFMILH